MTPGEPLTDALHRVEDLITKLYQGLPSLFDQDQGGALDSEASLSMIGELLQIKNDIGLCLFPISPFYRIEQARSER